MGIDQGHGTRAGEGIEGEETITEGQGDSGVFAQLNVGKSSSASDVLSVPSPASAAIGQDSADIVEGTSSEVVDVRGVTEEEQVGEVTGEGQGVCAGSGGTSNVGEVVVTTRNTIDVCCRSDNPVTFNLELGVVDEHITVHHVRALLRSQVVHPPSGVDSDSTVLMPDHSYVGCARLQDGSGELSTSITILSRKLPEDTVDVPNRLETSPVAEFHNVGRDPIHPVVDVTVVIEGKVATEVSESNAATLHVATNGGNTGVGLHDYSTLALIGTEISRRERISEDRSNLEGRDRVREAVASIEVGSIPIVQASLVNGE